MKNLAFRLHPGQLLKEEIESKTHEMGIKAGCLLSVVGSLKNANLRMAQALPDHDVVKEFKGPFEIVSGTGTLSEQGYHIHIAISDAQGKVLGGHLKGGCIVNTTVEIVIAILDGVVFKRELDEETGYDELKIVNL